MLGPESLMEFSCRSVESDVMVYTWSSEELSSPVSEMFELCHSVS